MPFDAQRSPSPVAGWDARLELGFRRAGERTVLAHRRHHGPLVVQKPLYPEGGLICHAIIVHPPGGIAGGDRLTLDVTLEARAQAVLMTPSATKWYRSDGRDSHQATRMALEGGTKLEYLPQETIVFDGARLRIDTEIALAEDAAYAGWDILCFGRRASGERFRTGRFRQRLDIRRHGRPIWHDRASIAGDDPMLTSPVGLGGASVSASMIVAAGAAPAALIAEARGIAPRSGLRWGITALPEIVSARYLGDQAEAARDWFEGLWRIFRPWYAGCAAQRPRLWST